MPMESCHLPLAFGSSHAIACNSLLEFAENTRQVMPSLIDYDGPESKHFRSRGALVRINGLALFSAVVPQSCTHAKVGGEESYTFGFHLAGECFFRVENKLFTIRPEISGVFLPAHCPWVVDVSSPSTVITMIDKSRLQSTAEIMLSEHFEPSMLSRFKNPAEIQLHYGAISFDQIFKRLCRQIDAYGNDQAMLDLSGLDDVFYRTLALALAPDVFARQSEKPFGHVGARQLNRVREYVMSHLDKRITLTDLEAVGCVSRRTLHNAFVQACAMSPMAWVREQRLHEARRLLNGRGSDLSITEVLYGCGFTNPSQFTAQYFRRFGELPSVTRSKSAL